MKKTLLWIMTLAMAGCASTTGVHETWKDFVAKTPSQNVPNNLAGVIFYRTADALPGKAVNIYVNEEYLASLLPGGYQQAAICPNNQKIGADFTGTDPAYQRKAHVGQSYNLAANEIVYFAVTSDGQGGATVQPVDVVTGQNAIASLARQNQTLPRLDRKRYCDTPLKQYTLDASALFHFDKSDYANMLPKGKAEIQAIAQDMQQYNTQVQRIAVIGYTDPEGSDSYNMALSQRRAATVKQALEANGISGNLIQPEGRGEQNLVVTDCQARFPKDRTARQACNQPNRRVEISLYGTQAVSE